MIGVTFETKEYNHKLLIREVQKYTCVEDFILAMVRNEFPGLKTPQVGGRNQLYFFEKKIGGSPYEFYKKCIDMEL